MYSYLFHYIAENSIIYLCITDDVSGLSVDLEVDTMQLVAFHVEISVEFPLHCGTIFDGTTTS